VNAEVSPGQAGGTIVPSKREGSAVAPGQEIAIRALGTALAGLLLASAVHMLAYGGVKTRVSNAEYLAIVAEPRQQAGVASPVKPPATPVIDMATTLPPAGSRSAAARFAP
jgi:hypothetical protein